MHHLPRGKRLRHDSVGQGGAQVLDFFRRTSVGCRPDGRIFLIALAPELEIAPTRSRHLDQEGQSLLQEGLQGGKLSEIQEPTVEVALSA